MCFEESRIRGEEQKRKELDAVALHELPKL